MAGGYGFSRTVPLAFRDAVPLVAKALEQEGFSVLEQPAVEPSGAPGREEGHTHGNGPRAHAVLEAFDPDVTRRIVAIGPELGLMASCRAVVLDHSSDNSTVCITDPVQTLGSLEHPSIGPIVDDLNRRLWRAYMNVVLRAAEPST